MHAASAPRLSSGIAVSILLHAALIGGFFLLRPGAQAPEAPTIAIQLIAAPSGERAAGVVQKAPPTPAPTPPAPAPVVKREIPEVKTPVAKPKPAPPPKKMVTATAPKTKTIATATAPKTAAPVKTQAPPPVAGGGAEGGKGADVANVLTEGVQFPWPYYTNNIVSRLIQRFGQMNGTLSASVHFVIRRDGTVDPESIQLVERSGNYSFDQRAKGAVEAAANAREFGPLPSGFREDILPVTMRFSPRIVR